MSALNISKPAGVLNGDLLFSVITISNSSANLNLPVGWTQLAILDSVNATFKMVICYRIANNEGSSYSFAVSGNDERMTGIVSAFRNVTTVDPIDSGYYNLMTIASQSIVAPSIQTYSTRAVLIGIFGVRQNATFTPPAGMIEIADVKSNTGTNSDNATELAYRVFSTPGLTGTATATSNSSDDGIGVLIAIH